MKKALFLIISLMLFLPQAFASKEGVLRLDSITIKSEGIGESGPILITGKQNEQNKFTYLKIEAFGRTYEIAQEYLNKIPKFPYNGIQLSYEHGYKELGGKTIYIIFQMGFTSGTMRQVLLSLSENGEVKIEEIK